MAKQFTIAMDRVIKEFGWTVCHLPRPAEEIVLTSKEVNRPGLVLNGYTLYFDADRIQMLGKMEHAFLESASRT